MASIGRLFLVGNNEVEKSEFEVLFYISESRETVTIEASPQLRSSGSLSLAFSSYLIMRSSVILTPERRGGVDCFLVRGRKQDLGRKQC
jgi:hypothetical protein